MKKLDKMAERKEESTKAQEDFAKHAIVSLFNRKTIVSYYVLYSFETITSSLKTGKRRYKISGTIVTIDLRYSEQRTTRQHNFGPGGNQVR